MGVKLVGGNVFRKYRRVSEMLSDPASMNRDIAVRLHQAVIRRFVIESDPSGQRWTPSRRALREGGQTLTDTGRLRASVRFAHGRNYAEVYTNSLVYAPVHNYGLGKMPKREFIGYGDDESRIINQTASEHLKRATG